MSTNEFTRQVRDALAHLFDSARLECHPLGDLLISDLAVDAVSRAQALRRVLLEAIDRLQPAARVPYGDTEWRPHRALFLRYVRRLPLAEILDELALSDRQYQREMARALNALTSLLWDQVRQARPPEGVGMEADGVSAEVRRLVAGARRDVLEAEELVGGAIRAVERLAGSRQVRIHAALTPHLPPIYGDGGLLRQIILNILSSLLEGTEGGDIRLTAESVEGAVWLCFAPQGVHGPAESNAPCEASHKLDLGRKLAQAIGGEVEVRGQVVHLRLPPPQQTILVIDDNQGILRLFERYLADGRFRVLGAQSLEQAVALARETRPFLITLDVMMPTHDGWEVLQSLKHNPETCHIPVAVCSILHETELAFSLGADDYISKPVTQQELLALLARWHAQSLGRSDDRDDLPSPL